MAAAVATGTGGFGLANGTVGWPSNERADRSGLRLLWRRHDDATTTYTTNNKKKREPSSFFSSLEMRETHNKITISLSLCPGWPCLSGSRFPFFFVFFFLHIFYSILTKKKMRAYRGKIKRNGGVDTETGKVARPPPCFATDVDLEFKRKLLSTLDL